MAVPLEKFVRQLEDSGVITGDTLKDFIPPKADPKDAEDLARELVRNKKLTKFQAEEISKGKGKSLILGNYVLMEKIGAGGMGQVFKARHRRMNRLVAVKLLPTSMTKDSAAIARFEREVQAAAKLNHPNIVTAHDADQSGGVHFLVMELVEGSDLAALVKKNGPFPTEKAVNYVLQVAKGLEAAHKKGIVHRDIKPANLLLDTEGTVKILDMGLARLSNDGEDIPQADLTNTGTVMGTVDYMSPEQALDTKTADARADIYALGCSLFYLLTGTPTYQGATLMKKLLAHRESPIPSLCSVRADVSEQLETVFRKMVAKKIEARYQTMSDVVAALESCRVGQSKTIELPSSDVEHRLLAPDKSVPSRTVTLKLQTGEGAIKSNGATETKTIKSFKEADFPNLIDNLPSTPIKPVRSKKAVTKGKHTVLNDKKKLLLIGAAALGLMMLLAAVVINMRTNVGTLVVTVMEPDAEVEVLNEKDTVEITRKGEKGKITIAVVPGKHRLKVQKDGFEIFTESFEIKSGKSASITAELKPLVKVAVASSNPWETPEFQKWIKGVQAMPAEKQVEAVSKKLVELNLGFDGKVEHQIENGQVSHLRFFADNVTDISPVRAIQGLASFECSASDAEMTETPKGKLYDLSPLTGLSLQVIKCNGTAVADLSPLKGMPLAHLFVSQTQVSDLSPLKGMPLKSLVCFRTKVSDLAPLMELRLTYLEIQFTHVSDLSPVRDMPLTTLFFHSTNVTDISPLTDMPLSVISLERTEVSDLAPLNGMKLTRIAITPSKIKQGINLLRQMTSLVTVIVSDQNIKRQEYSSNEFWKKYDAGEFTWNTPAFQLWIKDVQAMSAEKQVEAVSRKLVELNQEFDGKVTPAIEGDVVTALQLVTDNVTDISPVHSLTGLKFLSVHGSPMNKGTLRDLSPVSGMDLTEFVCDFNPDLSDVLPLRGMRLKSLNFSSTQVFDLSPLKGMPLEVVTCWGTKVTDLSPMRGMKLTSFNCVNTPVFDLSPLEGMPLAFLDFTATAVSDISPLQGMNLNTLACSATNIADLAPLRGMPLTVLLCTENKVSDLSPLDGMKLEVFFFTPKNIRNGINSIRQMATLKTIATETVGWGVKPEKPFTPEEFWKKYDAGDFGKPEPPTKPLAFQTPGFDQWIKEVQAMPAEKLIESVSKKLMELNPGFDGKLTNNFGVDSPVISNGTVTMVSSTTDDVADVSPLRAFVGLEFLACRGSSLERGKLRDLSPLNGMKMTLFDCSYNPRLSDLSPLKEMPLTRLYFIGTGVINLSILQGINLEDLWFASTDVSDLSPLKGMPLKHLMMWGTKVDNLSLLKGMELVELNIAATPIADLSPLKGMPLAHLTFNHTPISDLSPLKGMPLTGLNVSATSVTDLTPLEGMNLNLFYFTPKAISKGLDVIRQMRSLKTIGTSHEKSIPADEFWKRYDAGEFGKT